MSNQKRKKKNKIREKTQGFGLTGFEKHTPSTKYQRRTRPAASRLAMATGKTWGRTVKVFTLTPEEIAERYGEKKPFPTY